MSTNSLTMPFDLDETRLTVANVQLSFGTLAFATTSRTTMTVELLTEPDVMINAPKIERSILIIEDDKDQCDVLSNYLDRLGYRVLVSHRGQEGIALARQEFPDVILMDVNLPDSDGLALCEQLADDPKTSHIPVIILSASEKTNIVRQARRAGSRYFVRKPYDPNALLLLIVDSFGRELDEAL